MRRKIKVILKETIEGFGERGAILEVSAGYARNYLFRKDLAAEATPQNLKLFEENLKRLRKLEAIELQKLRDLAEKLDSTSIVYKVKSNEKGELYAAISPKGIAEKIREITGISVEEKGVELDSSIKQEGVYLINVNLKKDIKTSFWLWVVEDTTG